MATLKDVAQLAGVTVTTISRMLNNRANVSPKTREEIEQAMKELDYQPNEIAQSLIKQKSNIIGLIVPSARNFFFSMVIDHVERYASLNGYKLLLCISDLELRKEKEYFNNKLSQVIYNPNRFKVLIGEDRFLFGIVSAGDSEAPFSRLMQYKTLYDTLMDLDWKIKFSFDKAIEYAYSEPVQNNFSIFRVETEEERNAYYYIENALFRISSLWDLLAQFYRLFYKLEMPKERVYYKKVFDPSLQSSDRFKVKATEINNYLEESDDTDCEGEWKGNHSFVNDIRNKMTHRNSPNIAVMSDYDMNFKQHPTFIIKRILEDYVTASKYMKEILDEIEKEVMESFDTEQ